MEERSGSGVSSSSPHQHSSPHSSEPVRDPCCLPPLQKPEQNPAPQRLLTCISATKSPRMLQAQPAFAMPCGHEQGLRACSMCGGCKMKTPGWGNLLMYPLCTRRSSVRPLQLCPTPASFRTEGSYKRQQTAATTPRNQAAAGDPFHIIAAWRLAATHLAEPRERRAGTLKTARFLRGAGAVSTVSLSMMKIFWSQLSQSRVTPAEWSQVAGGQAKELCDGQYPKQHTYMQFWPVVWSNNPCSQY